MPSYADVRGYFTSISGREEPPRPRSCQDAEQRARQLLNAYLTAAQRQDLARKGYFKVKGQRTGRTYKLRKRWCELGLPVGGDFLTPNSLNVVDDRGVEYGYGFAPNYFPSSRAPRKAPPASDLLLAQKLMIESNELSFLRTACRVNDPRW